MSGKCLAASRLHILGKKLNIPSCASYIEFKNPGLHNQLSYLIKQTQTGSHGDGELLTIFKISEHQKVFIITHNHEIDEFILFVPEIRNVLEHATRSLFKR